MRICAILVAILAAPPLAVGAQDEARGPAAPTLARAAEDVLTEGTTEWMLGANLGWGVAIFRSSGGQRVLFPTVSWGRVLTEPRGPGRLRGRFSWALEMTPLFLQLEPARARGFGFSPLVWRWNFTQRGRVGPFAELGAGGLWTDVDIPAATSRANYVMHGTVAARWFTSRGRGWLVGYRFQHISNGNTADRNPGVNAHALVAGWSFLSPGRAP